MPIDFQNTRPATFEEAVNLIVESLNEKEIEFLRTNDPGALHHGQGTAMRNEWGLWEITSPLHQNLRTRFEIGHADDMSGMIFNAVAMKVRGFEFNAKAAAVGYRDFWLQQNIDPVTLQKKDSRRNGTNGQPH